MLPRLEPFQPVNTLNVGKRLHQGLKIVGPADDDPVCGYRDNARRGVMVIKATVTR